MSLECVRCGTVSPFERQACACCGLPFDERLASAADETPPLRNHGWPRRETVPAWMRFVLGTLTTALISAVGALAIYLVHRTMPELHPSFQVRAPARPDAAANQNLQQTASAAQAKPPKAQPTSAKPQTTAAKRPQRDRNRPRTNEPARAQRG